MGGKRSGKRKPVFLYATDQLTETGKRKFEYRNPKFETNSNDENPKTPNKPKSESVLKIYPILGLLNCCFVSDSDIRISDFD
jgi:hypothetical protein